MRASRLLPVVVIVALAPALAGCATCFWMCFSPLLNEHGGGEVVAFERANASIAYPGHPWLNVPPDDDEVDENVTRIHLMRLDPVAGFILVAEEGTDATFTTERLADVALENLQAASKDVKSGERAPQDLGGLDGLRFESTADVDGDRFRYIHWVAARNGFLYQLIAYAPADVELRPMADELFASFRQLDPSRMSSKITVERFTQYEDPALGLSVDLSNERFATWAPDDNLAHVSVGGTRFDTGTFFGLSPLFFEGPRPSSDALLHAALGFLDYGVPDPDVKRLGAAEDGGVLVERYAMEKRHEADTWHYRIEVRSTPERALLSVVWGRRGEEEVEDAAARVAASVRFGPPRAGASLDERQTAVQAGLANSIGVHYWNARQYADAVRWMKRAIRLAPDNVTYADNLFAAYNRNFMHAEAVDTFTTLPEALRQKPTLRAWQAWHLKEAGERAAALAVYEKLFAAGHEDEDDLIGYVTLLTAADRADEGMVAYRAYAVKHPSKNLYVTLARELSKQGKPELALAVLHDGKEKLGVVPDLAFARMEVYEAGDRYRDVLEACDELIAAGYASADVFHWQGRARYQLEWYRDARKSFEQVLALRPNDEHAKEWIAEISALLGESGDLDLDVPLSPVPIPNELKAELARVAAEDASFPGYGAFYEYRLHAVDVRDGRERETFYRRIRVTGERGIEDLSTLKWSFEPPAQQIFVNRVEVRDAAGALVKQGEARDYYVIHNREDGVASTRRTLHIPLPKLAAGNTIDVVVTLSQGAGKERLPFVKSRLSSTRPVRLAAVSMTGDVAHLEHYARHAPAGRSIDGGYLWLVKDPPVYRWQPLELPWEDSAPYVVVGDRRAEWRALAREYLARIEDRLVVDDEVRRVAQRVVGDAKRDDEKLRAIWRHVQLQVKYQAIEFGTRGVIPETAATTLSQGYGDCKDHAVLLRAMLAAVGIPSTLVLIDTDAPLERDLPSLDQFNHMILHVPGRGGGRFLDATDKDIGLEMRVPAGLGGKEALLLSEAPRLVTLPPQQAGSRARVNRTIVVDADAGFTVKEEMVLDGYLASFLRGGLKRVDTANQKQWAQDVVTSELPQATVESIRVENLLDNGAPLVVTIEYETRAGMIARGDELVLSLPAMWDRYYLALRTSDDRDKPFVLRYPYAFTSTTRVRARGGVILAATPGVKQGRTSSMRYTSKVSGGGDEVEVELSVEIRAGTYPAADMKRHRDVLDAGLRAAQESVHAVRRAASGAPKPLVTSDDIR